MEIPRSSVCQDLSGYQPKLRGSVPWLSLNIQNPRALLARINGKGTVGTAPLAKLRDTITAPTAVPSSLRVIGWPYIWTTDALMR